MDQLEQDFNAAVLGDEAASARFLAEVRQMRAALSHQQAGQIDPEFLEAFAEFRGRSADILSNETDRTEFQRVDALLAQAHPSLDYRTRLNVAGNHVRSGAFQPVGIDADRAQAIQDMREMRTAARRGAELPRTPEDLAKVPHPDDTDEMAIQRMVASGRRAAREIESDS